MKSSLMPAIGMVFVLTFMACQQSPVQTLTSSSKAVGTLELTFDSQTSKATALVHAGNLTRAVQTNTNVTFRNWSEITS